MAAPSASRTVLLTLLVLIALYGAWQLNRLSRALAYAPFVERQVELYTEVSRAASLIAHSDDAEERDEARQTFMRLMRGPLVVFADETASWSVALFETCMTEPDNEKCKDRDLSQLSTGLSRAMRKSLSDTARLGLMDFNR